MEKIQVILKEDVPNLGRSGELVSVKPGYSRNYLIPQGLALAATRKNIARLEHEKKIIEARTTRTRKDAESLAQRIAGVTLQLDRQVGEGDKLFGSVTSRDIEEALGLQGIQVDRKKIQIADPIKSLGQYTVDIKLSRDVAAQVKVWVVAKQ
ncbi:MAG: 50S ribosomal protein L9 [Deltaproteobacteria bacterium]|nr:50S ribosomal protein L9 [Deltaproteobacteria bacterium]